MSKPPRDANDPNPVIIKKYANRRLYDTESSCYITLERLSKMTRAGREFKVVDARSGDDITHTILTQIIVEEETRGTTLLPVSFLRQLISMYGDQMQTMVPGYLEASMEAFRRNQEQVRSTMLGIMGGSANPFEALARQNLAMMKAATGIWNGPGPRPESAEAAPETAAPQTSALQTSALRTSAPRTSAPQTAADELKSLRAELQQLQSRIDRLVEE